MLARLNKRKTKNKQEDTWNVQQVAVDYVQQVVVSHVRGVHAYQTQSHALRRCTKDWMLLNTRLVDVQSTSYVIKGGKH